VEPAQRLRPPAGRARRGRYYRNHVRANLRCVSMICDVHQCGVFRDGPLCSPPPDQREVDFRCAHPLRTIAPGPRERRIPTWRAPGFPWCSAGSTPGSTPPPGVFAPPGNRFWPTLHRSGFTPRQPRPEEQGELLDLSSGSPTSSPGPRREPTNSSTDETRLPAKPTAEQRMWAYYVTERAKARTPTGAKLDRIAGTNNYGRKVLRRWRQAGHLPPGISGSRSRGTRPTGREQPYASPEES
jgi:hypothetical protein